MKLNTHGLKMKGIRAASGDTQDYGYYSPSYIEIFYDRSTGEIWTKYQHSLGHNWWTQYDDPDVIKICNASEHLTMQQIADLIAERVAMLPAPWSGEYYDATV